MTAAERFAKWRSGLHPREHPLSSLHMHSLDHRILESLGAAVEGLDQLSRAVEFSFARRERAVAGFDLAGVDQALAVEAEPSPFLRLGNEPLVVVEAVEHAVEHGDASRTRGEHD